jgi:hypothetical protein
MNQFPIPEKAFASQWNRLYTSTMGAGQCGSGGKSMVQELVHADADDQLWYEGIWVQLLRYIKAGQVVPIIGPDLLRVEHEGKEVLLDRYIAGRLADVIGLPPDLLPAEPTLNQVVCQCLHHKKREAPGLYGAVEDILSQAAFSPPRPLLQLAEIVDFKLFVTTNFDSLLEKAIDSVRFGGRSETLSLAYSREQFKDLEAHNENPQRPTVYHLLGVPSPNHASYVISDGDLLDFICALQSDKYRPELLFDELEKKHLLLLGGNFSDWLARFFLRMAKQHSLSGSRAELEILADSRTQHDTSLVLFLQHFSSGTRVFRGGSVEFVDQLCRRWRERYPPSGEPELKIIPPAPQMPSDAVFISYANEDRGAVQLLKAGLDAARLNVWFDKDRLHLGDNFGPKIEKNILNCSCFVAVLSRNTERRKEAYFRKEWNLAVDRSTRIDSGTAFLLPVIVDDTKEFECVPREIRQKTRTRLPGGRATAEFVEEVRAVVNAFLARKQAE